MFSSIIRRLKKSSTLIVNVIALLADSIAIIQLLNTDQKPFYIIALLILLFVQTIYNGVLLNKLSFITNLARYGHINLVRMVLLHDLKMMRRVSKVSAIKATSAIYSFKINANKDDTSNIDYNHEFDVQIAPNKEPSFSVWLFGDNDTVPKDCKIVLSNHTYPQSPRIVDDNETDYVRSGIYSLNWTLNSDQNTRSEKLFLTYTRENAYYWSFTDEVFVIHPKSFIPGVTKASFKLTFDDDSKVSHITVNEIHGRRITERPMLIPHDQEKVYSCDQIQISEDAVYTITIHHKGQEKSIS